MVVIITMGHQLTMYVSEKCAPSSSTKFIFEMEIMTTGIIHFTPELHVLDQNHVNKINPVKLHKIICLLPNSYLLLQTIRSINPQNKSMKL